MLTGRGEDRLAQDADDPRRTLVAQVRFSQEMRRVRQHHFGRAQLSGANWDMMLQLMLAREHDRQLSPSYLATGAAVPLSSGLRLIPAPTQDGRVRAAST